MPASGYEEFHERFEDEATREERTLLAMPLPSLLDRVREGAFGAYYQLWPAIASKASLQQAAWPLFDVLNSDADYLTRYHCANALITIAGRTLAGSKAVMFSAGPAHTLRDNLAKVRATLEAVVGKRV